MSKRTRSVAASSEEPAAKRSTGTIRWESATDVGHLIFHYNKDSLDSSKIAGFDFDSTLVECKSGKKFATSPDDWRMLFPEVTKKIKELHEQGFKICIFTNQGGIGKGKQKEGDIKKRITSVMEAVGVPMSVFMAPDDDHFRKPSTAMWDYMEEHCNGGVAVDRNKCVYVGDAAGRQAGWAPGKKKDFSCGDRKFAMNLKVAFHTPEEFFLGARKAPFVLDVLDPSSIPTDAPLLLAGASTSSGPTKELALAKEEQELVVLVGYPASGKSTFAKKHFVSKGYVRVNQDTLKSKDRCIKAAKEAVGEGKSVIIDNTNPASDTRRMYIQVAKDSGVKVRCFHLQTSLELAHHLNLYRERVSCGESRHVPDVAYNKFKKDFEEPAMSEGFDELHRVNFVPTFESDKHKEVFFQYT